MVSGDHPIEEVRQNTEIKIQFAAMMVPQNT